MTWDKFNPKQYHESNYKTLRDDDRQILTLTRDYFREVLSPARHGIDVGSGANLYPALALLPWCTDITLWEYGAQNVEWLVRETASYGPEWDSFADILTPDVADSRASLAQRTAVVQGSIYALPTATWDVGTMFFVAESITDQRKEFERAVASFLGCLKPGSPFVAAFMTGSTGYQVGNEWFPAVNISTSDLGMLLADLGATGTVHDIESDLRPGHGMVLVTGTEAS